MLALALALLPAFAPDGDETLPIWQDSFATTLPATPTLKDTAFAGGLATSAGELTIGFGAEARVKSYVRAWDRATGVELWARTFAEEEALAVATNAAGTQVFAVLRRPSEGGEDGLERLVVLAGADGAIQFVDERPISALDPLRESDVDALVLSPSGLTLYRLDFAELAGLLRITALDMTTGAERWSRAQAGYDMLDYYDVPDGEASLAVAPDSASVYVTFEERPFFGERDVAVGRYSALDGGELWTARTTTVGVSDRCTPPYPLPDGSGVVYARWTLPSTIGSTVEKLAASDGSSAWTLPSTLINPAAAFSSSGNLFALSAAVGFPSDPDGQEQRVECFDAGLALPTFGLTYPGVILSDTPRHIVFDDAGADLYAMVGREDTVFGQTQEMFVRAIDATTGASRWYAPLHAASPSALHVAHWLDAPPTGGIAGGWSGDQGPNGGLERTALAGPDGSAIWSFETSDELATGLSPIGRVFPSADGASVWTWPLVVDAGFDAVGLRLERRALADGSLLDEFEVPSSGLSSHAFEVSVSPYAELAALVVPVPGTFDEELVLRDLGGGTQQTVAIPTLGFGGGRPAFAWTEDGTRLYAAVSGTVGRLYAVDLPGGTIAWQGPYFPPTSLPFGGGAFALGLVVDPATNAPIVLWRGQGFTPGMEMPEVAKFRYAAGDGQEVWSSVTAADDLVLGAYEFRATASAGNLLPFSTRFQGLRLAPDGSRLFFVGAIDVASQRRTLVQALDAATGAVLWTKTAAEDLGFQGAIVDAAVSADGARVHVLASGSEVLGIGGAHLVTLDAATGAILWERFLAEAVDSVRGLASVGQGLRLAVGVSLGTDTPAGSLVVTLDARTGEELWRLEQSGAGGELCDFLVTAGGSLVTVGQGLGAEGVVGFTRRDDLANLQDGTTGISVAAGGIYPLHLDFGPDEAGNAYIVVGSGTGTSPPVLFAGLTIPLVFDAYTTLTIGEANRGFFDQTLGLLDAAGDARARIVVPAGVLDPSLVGVTLYHAAIRYDLGFGAFSGVTQAVATTLLP